jgi:hypothetical protein
MTYAKTPQSAASAPIKFNLDGTPVAVSEDTVTPSNSHPLPVIPLDTDGAVFDVRTLNQEVTQTNVYTELTVHTEELGLVDETMPAADNDPSGLNGRLQRIAVHQTELNTIVADLATEATLGSVLGDTNALVTDVASIDSKTPAVGQALMAASVPVAIASDQSALPVSQSGAWNITNVSGTVSLPTGASTSALQTSGNASLTSIDSKLTSPLTISLPTGASTAAKQDTGNASLASIDGKIVAVNTGAVVVSSSALPTGAATEATLSTLDGKVPSNLTVTSTRLLVDGSGVTQPVSGTVAATQTGTWTVQPGNTSNTTAWKVDGSAVTQPVSLASVPAPINSAGSIVNTSLSATTASTASKPANAVGFIIQAPSDNTDNIRFAVGGTASTTVGMLMEPGRDSGYLPLAANISVCATVSGTNAFSIQWVLAQ